MRDVEQRLEEVRARHGVWTAHNIALPGGAFTIGPTASIMDIRRGDYFVALSQAIFRGPLNGLRVLDLGCLEGGLAIQFGRAGAEVDGVDIRGDSIAKARVAAQILEMNAVRFFEGDALALPLAHLHTSYDIVLCAGLLYHLDARDQLPFLQSLAVLCRGVTLIDTHVAHEAVDVHSTGEGLVLHGRHIEEGGGSPMERRDAMWASWANNRSFWLTEPSLCNALYAAGFRLVTKAAQPVFPWPWQDRATWIAFRGADASCVFEAGHLPESDDRPSNHPTVAAGRNLHVRVSARGAPNPAVSVSHPMARSKSTAWQAVAEELAAWAATGSTPQFWWRDDDAFSETAPLRRLRELLSQETLVLAVVPGRLQDDLVRSLESWPRVVIVQHGWMHLNHAETGALPSEYPSGRLQAEVEDELARGQRILLAAFQARFRPVFVPPWHRCAPWILHNARGLGFDGVSGQAPPFPLLRHGYAGEVNIEIDISDWTGEGRFVGVGRIASQVHRALRLRREWSAWDAPIGILSHHQRLVQQDFHHLADIIGRLRDHGVRWASGDRLFAPSPIQKTAL